MQDWALVVYKNNDLVEIGLTGLTRILRGGVRVSKNARLCYADSIDWDRMTHPDYHEFNVIEVKIDSYKAAQFFSSAKIEPQDNSQHARYTMIR